MKSLIMKLCFSFVTEMEKGTTLMMFAQFVCSTTIVCLILFYLAEV